MQVRGDLRRRGLKEGTGCDQSIASMQVARSIVAAAAGTVVLDR